MASFASMPGDLSGMNYVLDGTKLPEISISLDQPVVASAPPELPKIKLEDLERFATDADFSMEMRAKLAIVLQRLGMSERQQIEALDLISQHALTVYSRTTIENILSKKDKVMAQITKTPLWHPIKLWKLGCERDQIDKQIQKLVEQQKPPVTESSPVPLPAPVYDAKIMDEIRACIPSDKIIIYGQEIDSYVAHKLLKKDMEGIAKQMATVKVGSPAWEKLRKSFKELEIIYNTTVFMLGDETFMLGQPGDDFFKALKNPSKDPIKELKFHIARYAEPGLTTEQLEADGI